MNTVFIGGSRHVSRLPAQATERLQNIVDSGFPILVGDADGADKAVQKHLHAAGYARVTVFCTGDACRNNVGGWTVSRIPPPKGAKGFQFYAAKDREMAAQADFGLMIWDGKSPGTVLNVLRLVRGGKKAVLVDAAAKSMRTFKTRDDWTSFLAECPPELRRDFESRATPEEWEGSLLPADAPPAAAAAVEPASKTDQEMTAAINSALASGDTKGVVELLGQVAKAHGMSQVAKETGLAREGLYRALSSGGNPEFATVLKVMESVGLRLMVGGRG